MEKLVSFSLFHRNQKWTRTVAENDSMWLESRMEARFSTFSANRCDLLVIFTFRTPSTLLHISLLKTKTYKVIISHVVQL